MDLGTSTSAGSHPGRHDELTCLGGVRGHATGLIQSRKHIGDALLAYGELHRREQDAVLFRWEDLMRKGGGEGTANLPAQQPA